MRVYRNHYRDDFDESKGFSFHTRKTDAAFESANAVKNGNTCATEIFEYPVSKRGMLRALTECATHPDNGFTLIELTVVIVIIAILASMLLPAMARARKRAAGVQCISNQRQISMAWASYVSDSADRLPFAYGYSDSTWLPRGLYGGDIDHSPLRPYVGGNVTGNHSVWRCPSVPRDSWDYTDGWPTSQSINYSIGGGEPDRWETNEIVIHHRLGSITGEETSRLFLLADGGAIAFSTYTGSGWNDPAHYRWNTWPAFWHNRAAALTFLDGHSEIHKWRDPRTYPDPMPGTIGIEIQPFNQDIAWLQWHAVTTKQ